MKSNSKMTIGDWYSGRSIFVTGGTGFMGKVLLEKLLRSCSLVERIYVLVRVKRGCSAEVRIQRMLQLPLFDLLRTTAPEMFSKLVPVTGDISQPGLGLSDEDRQRITTQVSVVFNGAASLRMEAGLKASLQLNTVPTERLLLLAREMPLLEAFIHLSTAFCHCEEEILHEKIYPSKEDPSDVINAVMALADDQADKITAQMLGVHPNCYTYSKRLSESLVEKMGTDVHAAIIRPSIVLPTYREPIPGWVDTLNGPVGILVGAGKGVIRTMMCGSEFAAELIPVDIAINCIISVAWKVGTEKPSGVPVYNVSQSTLVKITWGDILDKARKLIKVYPLECGAWYPDGTIRTNKFIHNLLVFLLHIIPAYFIDFIMIIIRQPRFMVRVQKRISEGLEVLQYFTMRKWHFRNTRMLAVSASLCATDKNIFYMDNVDVDIDDYMKDCILGARVYCLKEPLSSLPLARIHMKMLYCLDRVVACLFYGFLCWIVFRSLQVFGNFQLFYISN